MCWYHSGPTFAVIDERRAKVEGQRIRGIHEECPEGEVGTRPHRRLYFHETALLHMPVVQIRQNGLDAKRLGGTDGRDDFLGEAAALGTILERRHGVLGDELAK